MSNRRVFAIVPAAGRSRRMGAPKLLLQLGGRTVIDTVLKSWIDSCVCETVVVARADDATLLARCRRHDVHLIATESKPIDMRATLIIGLHDIMRRLAPSGDDAWMVAPADLPGLTTSLINAVASRYDPLAPRIVVPCRGGRRGHPVLLPWSAAAPFCAAAGRSGLNEFLRRQPGAALNVIDVGAEPATVDLDTPLDLRHWLGEGMTP